MEFCGSVGAKTYALLINNGIMGLPNQLAIMIVSNTSLAE